MHLLFFFSLSLPWVFAIDLDVVLTRRQTLCDDDIKYIYISKEVLKPFQYNVLVKHIDPSSPLSLSFLAVAECPSWELTIFVCKIWSAFVSGPVLCLQSLK